MTKQYIAACNEGTTVIANDIDTLMAQVLLTIEPARLQRIHVTVYNVVTPITANEQLNTVVIPNDAELVEQQGIELDMNTLNLLNRLAELYTHTDSVLDALHDLIMEQRNANPVCH